MADTKSLYEILAEVQAELENPPLDAKNPHFNSSYTKLSTILDMLRPKFAKRGVFLTQRNDYQVNEGQTLRFLVTEIHKGEETLELDRWMMPYTGKAQQDGSATTYAKRYSLCEIFALAGEEDDDGEAANSNSDLDVTCPTCGKAWKLKNDGRIYQCDCGTRLSA